MRAEFGFILAVVLVFAALAPLVSAAQCGVYVHNLDVLEAERITFNITNTGETDADITYDIFVGWDKIDTADNVSLDVNETFEGLTGHTFHYGTYQIKVVATADCGSYDEEHMAYAQLTPLPQVCANPEGVQGDIRCDFQGGFLLECRDGQWVYSAEDASCQASCHPNCEGEKTHPLCRVDIETLDYIDRVSLGNPIALNAKIKNTGRSDEIINLKFYVKGKLWRDYFLPVLGRDEYSIETITYYPNAGDSEFQLEAITNCSASDTKIGTFTVIEPSPAPTPPSPAPTPTPLETSVTINPRQLDIPNCEGKPVSIEIDSSRAQNLTISVAGVTSDWLQYPSRVTLDGRKTFYLYITPQTLGTYNITVTVAGEAETFQEDISFYVVPKGPALTGNWLLDLLYSYWLFILLILAIIIFILVLIFGTGYYSKRGRY